MSLREQKQTRKQRRIAMAKKLATGAVILLAFATLARVADRPPEVNPDLTTQLEEIKEELKTLKRQQKTMQGDIDKLKDTTKEPEWLKNEQSRSKLRSRRRVLADARGGNWIGRIDQYLAGTPLAGQGRTFFMAAVDNGLPPNLSAGIAKRESQLGRHIPPGSHNPFGMTAGTAPGYGVVSARGPDGTRPYQAFPSWETAIREHAEFIARHWGAVSSPRQMRGYAMDPAWANGVVASMGEI